MRFIPSFRVSQWLLMSCHLAYSLQLWISWAIIFTLIRFVAFAFHSLLSWPYFQPLTCHSPVLPPGLFYSRAMILDLKVHRNRLRIWSKCRFASEVQGGAGVSVISIITSSLKMSMVRLQEPHFDGEVLRYYVYFLVDQSISSPSTPSPPATPMLMVLRSLNCGTLENAGIFLPICLHGVGSTCLGLK